MIANCSCAEILIPCSLTSFFGQCVTLVDYYAPLFFSEVSMISPEQFCDKVNLCDETAQVSLLKSGDACTLCQNVLGEVLSKLQDPDTEVVVNPLYSQMKLFLGFSEILITFTRGNSSA